MELTYKESEERIALMRKFHSNVITAEERKRLSDLTMKLVKSFTKKA